MLLWGMKWSRAICSCLVRIIFKNILSWLRRAFALFSLNMMRVITVIIIFSIIFILYLLLLFIICPIWVVCRRGNCRYTKWGRRNTTHRTLAKVRSTMEWPTKAQPSALNVTSVVSTSCWTTDSLATLGSWTHHATWLYVTYARLPRLFYVLICPTQV